MRPRNAALACLLILVVAKGQTPAGGRTFLPIGDDDAKLLRAVLSERFPSWPSQVFVFDTTAAFDPATATHDSQRSLRGSDLGQNVTPVTSREALDTLAKAQDSAVLVELTLPQYETDRHHATVKYKVMRHTPAGLRFLNGTGTVALRNEQWTMTNRQESAESGSPLRVGGDVKAPVLVKRVEATSTPEAILNRISGIVIIEALIDETGHVSDARVLKPLPFGLDAAAVAAVKQWEFKPGTLNGKPVPVLFNLTVQFIAK
jgi:TonB family protein